MAEARSAVTEPRVGRIEEGRSAQHDFFVGLRASLIRRFFRTRNLLYNGMWPTNIWNLVLMVGSLTGMMTLDWPCCQPLNAQLHSLGDILHIPPDWPLAMRSFVISFFTGFVFFIIFLHVRRYSLRLLLSYRGWMYEQPKTQGVATLLWGLLVKMVSGSHPILYGCQQSLPRMPVPPLKHTLKGLIQSLKPLYGEDSETIKNLKEESKKFQKTLGPKLQRILYLKSWWAQNYVSDFWEKYVYLMGRNPLPINSNYYVLDQGHYCPTRSQVTRAASITYQFYRVSQMIAREQIRPLLIRNTVPVCMGQYERVFSTTRVPGEDMDSLVHYSSTESRHVVVYRKGIMYKLDLFDKQRRLLTPHNLEKQYQWIIEDAEKYQDSTSVEEKSVPALTGTDRKTWAKVRSKYFTSGINQESLEMIEKAVFCVSLVTDESEDFSTRAKCMMHADGRSIWFDKSLTLLVLANGRMGLHCEHSMADAPVIAHCLEHNLTEEIVVGLYDADGKCKSLPEDARQNPLTPPHRLQWEVPAALTEHINRAVPLMQQAINDLDLHVMEYTHYGKGFMKLCKVSPDAYIQMALQVTYFKNAGKYALTYESSMTRLYLNGRTETVRSLTLESVEFVKAFLDKKKCRKEVLASLQKACSVHASTYKDCMNGRGVDRHLFALFVISKGLDYDCEFLQKCLSLPWTLSTSQAPQQQMPNSPSCDLPQYRDKISPGGGFGPVTDEGYGVAYMVPGDFKVFFHVSSKHSCKATSSTLFMKQLFETLDEMKSLFEVKR